MMLSVRYIFFVALMSLVSSFFVGSLRAGTGMNLAMAAERTYIMIKPDGVQRGLTGEIISRFEKKGYTLRGLKLYSPPRDLLEKHYCDLAGKSFFPKLMDYMTSGPVCCMAWEGTGAVATGRKMLGATNPLESTPGTIRGDYALDVGRNVCHGSDSVENGEKEISLWFPEGLQDYENHSDPWVYE